jgi:PAS domain S-box-containing protein
MNIAQKINVSKNLKLGFGTLIVIFFLFGMFILYDINKVSKLSLTVYNHPLVVSNAALQVNVSISKMHRSMKDVVLFGSPSKIQQSVDAVSDEEVLAYRHFNIVRKNILGEKGKFLEKEARELFDEWRQIRNEVIGLVNKGQNENAANITIGKGAEHVAILEEKMFGLTNYARDKASEFTAETQKVHTRLNITSIFFLALGILTSLLVAFWALKRTESAGKKLQESEEKYRILVENANDAILVAQDGVIKFSNQKTEELSGYLSAELIKMPFVDLIHPDDKKKVLERYKRRLKGEKIVSTYSFKIVQKSGFERTVHIDTVLIQWENKPATLNFLRDITQQIKIEEELKQAQKMESIGILAGGIAHDFNNLLFVVMGYISLAQDDLKPESEASESLREAEDACIKAKELTARLITFSEGGDPVKKINSIEELLKETVVSAVSGSNIKPEISIADDIRQVIIDEAQIKQVFRHIVVNAKEAMDDNGPLNVSCENIDIAEESYLTLSQGEYIKISFKDQGCGISKENLNKIFDPYFSTKDMGTDKGQGLGLTVSHSIIKKHGGLITVESELEKGSIVSVILMTR